MKKQIIILIALVVILVGLSFFISDSNDNISSQNEFFQEEMVRIGVERVGQPIEGFNAFMYLQAFPGLIEEDFDGVQTIEGIYNFAGTALTFKRTDGQPISSAEEMISEAGYQTLLFNLSTRLDIEVNNVTDVATLIEKLQEDGEPVGILPFDSGVSGQVLRGPICPVMREGDDSCGDQPYATAVQVIAKNSPNSSPFATVDTDKDGNYKFMLPPGDYSIQAIGGKPFPSCGSTDIIIKPNEVLELDLSCDTGIR